MDSAQVPVNGLIDNRNEVSYKGEFSVAERKEKTTLFEGIGWILCNKNQIWKDKYHIFPLICESHKKEKIAKVNKNG